MRNIKILALLMSLVLLVGCFAACNGEEGTTSTTSGVAASEAPVVYENPDPADAVKHEDFTSVYDMIGSKVTIDMVTGSAGIYKVTVDEKEYELGMDFLSMAMVYNTKPIEGNDKYDTAEEIYNQWWKMFVERYNYMALEIPLYSNQYFDLYYAKIEGFKTSPYWGAASAIVGSTIKEGEKNSVILGSSTELSGAFRNSSWGKSSPGSSDLDIEELTSGYSTVQTGFDGAMLWNMQALAEEPVATLNEDGTLTYTIKVKNDLVFSDGSKINAKNFIASLLANATPVSVAAGGTGASGMTAVGYEEFKAYDGTNADEEGVSKYFAGVKLIDEYSFSYTLQPDYANYYYAMSYASFSPVPMALYLGDNDIIVAEDGSCGIADGFYATTEKDGVAVYNMVDVITANLKWDSKLPYSGPYTVKNYDASTKIATLEINPNYPGDDARGKATIETITYVKMIEETQLDQFKTGQIEVLAGITGGPETKAALALIDEDPSKYAETHYDRAGYGFIGLRCDLGPTSDIAVRQAMMYTINRPEFAQTFTGGFGSVVHGPYYEGAASFQAVKDEIKLNDYTYSSDAAIDALVEGGWIYNVEGKEFNAEKDAVRYKKLSGYELSEQNIKYATTDNKYKTVKINGEYYMPLAINWYGTQPNTVTDQLITAWQENANATTAIGAYITYTSCEFTQGLYGDYLQIEAYGWDGVAKCCAINYATGFNSAIYDFAFNFTIDPDLYADYSRAYVMDEADFWENYK